MGIRLGGLLGLITIALAAGPAGAEVDPRFKVGPPPTWVRVIPPDLTAVPPAGEISSGVHVLLSDTQVRAAETSAVRYRHLVRRVLSADGVAAVSEIQISFDPSYQTLSLHQVRVLRGKDSRDALRKESVKLIQEEEDLSARMFNGRVTALLVLEDIRPGDIIDYEYSLSGSNPVFGGHFTELVDLASVVPLQHWSYRLLAPVGRGLRFRVHGTALNPKEEVSGGQTELVWERHAVPPIRGEDQVPSWYRQAPFLEVTDFDSWREVATWASTLFAASAADANPELERQVGRWIKDHPQPEERLRAALDFVQRDIRYFGIEMGANSHRPHRPSEVFAQRFGDCKDKAYLLTTLLRRLGIQSYPALVSTEYRRGLDDLLPSATVFDHVIVVATVDGKEHWLDATDSSSRGLRLEQRSTAAIERALVVTPTTTALRTVPDEAEGALEVEEAYELKDYQGKASLRVLTRFSGSFADNQRANLAHVSREELGRSYLNFQAHSDPGITMEALPTIRDDESANLIVIEEQYAIADFWKDARHNFSAYTIADNLRSPSYTLRSMPLSIAHPQKVHHAVTIHLPDDWRLDDEERTIEGLAFRFHYRFQNPGRTLRYDFDYVSKTDYLPPVAVPEHLRKVEAVSGVISRTIHYGPDRPRESIWTSVAVLGLVGSIPLGFFGWLILRGLPAQLRRRRYQQVLALGDGEAPASAMEVGSAAEISRRLPKLRCGKCGKKGTLEAQSMDEARLGDQQLLVQRHRCQRCQAEGRTYFKVKA
ncbi:MAG: DUF3857 domain-containing protein [Myxococcota bacterium]